MDSHWMFWRTMAGTLQGGLWWQRRRGAACHWTAEKRGCDFRLCYAALTKPPPVLVIGSPPGLETSSCWPRSLVGDDLARVWQRHALMLSRRTTATA